MYSNTIHGPMLASANRHFFKSSTHLFSLAFHSAIFDLQSAAADAIFGSALCVCVCVCLTVIFQDGRDKCKNVESVGEDGWRIDTAAVGVATALRPKRSTIKAV